MRHELQRAVSPRPPPLPVVAWLVIKGFGEEVARLFSLFSVCEGLTCCVLNTNRLAVLRVAAAAWLFAATAFAGMASWRLGTGEVPAHWLTLSGLAYWSQCAPAR